MMDLRTRYLGLDLRSPLVASPSPLTGDLDGLHRRADAGVGAVVLPSLFEEQVVHDVMELDRVSATSADSHTKATTYLPELDDYNDGSWSYLALVDKASSTLEVPVIASLNGVSRGGWARHAALLADAGAAAIELNMYAVGSDPEVTGAELEARLLDLVAAVRAAVRIPLAVKLSPFFTSFANLAVRVVEAGADGLVLFNRFYQPDLDLDSLQMVPRLTLSTSEELRLPLRWIAILRGRVRASLALTSGVYTGHDAAKALLAGADVAMMTSALLRHGPGHVRRVERELVACLTQRELSSLDEVRGSLRQEATPDPAADERANYLRTLLSYGGRFGQTGSAPQDPGGPGRLTLRGGMVGDYGGPGGHGGPRR